MNGVLTHLLTCIFEHLLISKVKCIRLQRGIDVYNITFDLLIANVDNSSRRFSLRKVQRLAFFSFWRSFLVFPLFCKLLESRFELFSFRSVSSIFFLLLNYWRLVFWLSPQTAVCFLTFFENEILASLRHNDSVQVLVYLWRKSVITNPNFLLFCLFLVFVNKTLNSVPILI